MIDDMGVFRTTVQISSLTDTETRRELTDVVVDTGAEYSFIPRSVLTGLGIQPARTDRFQIADGRVLKRDVGYAMLFAAGCEGPTIVAFAEPGDKVLLGAFGLEGLNLRVDLNLKLLVPMGPIPW